MWYVLSFRTLMMALLVLLNLAPSVSYSLSSALPQSQNVAPGVQSYHEWKKTKIHDAQNKIKNLKEKIETDPNLKYKSMSTEAGLVADLNRDLEQEILNLSLTQDLSISDYFVGYLTKQSSLESAIKDVSVRLNPEEVAELMLAYAENFLQSRPAAMKPVLRADSAQ